MSTIDASDARVMTLYAQCHCRGQTIKLPFARQHFPLSAETCHCDDCRQITGLLANDFLMLRSELTHDPFDPDNLPEGLLKYTPQRVTWYFCRTCGCHLIQSSPRTAGDVQESVSRHQWYVSTGVVYPFTLPSNGEGSTERIFQRVRHSWVRPGLHMSGLARFMADNLPRYPSHDDYNAEPLPASAHDIHDPKPEPNADERKQIDDASAADSLPIRCRCNYVRLRLLRPHTHDVDERFHSIIDASQQKWRFNICTCNSCRTTTGFEGGSVVLFTTHKHVVPDEGHAQDFEHAPPNCYDAQALQGDVDRPSTRGLCTYESSGEMKRRFCPRCGSSIFIDFVEFGPSICDLYMGNLVAPLRAVWTSWSFKSPKISWLPYCRDPQLAEQLRSAYSPEQDYTLSEPMKAMANAYSGELVL